jgi:hypothetical protein
VSRVRGFGFGIWGLGFRVWDLGFLFKGLGFDSGPGFQVKVVETFPRVLPVRSEGAVVRGRGGDVNLQS